MPIHRYQSPVPALTMNHIVRPVIGVQPSPSRIYPMLDMHVSQQGNSADIPGHMMYQVWDGMAEREMEYGCIVYMQNELYASVLKCNQLAKCAPGAMLHRAWNSQQFNQGPCLIKSPAAALRFPHAGFTTSEPFLHPATTLTLYTLGDILLSPPMSMNGPPGQQAMVTIDIRHSFLNPVSSPRDYMPSLCI
ncbi:hypothetical protein K504DRAFT_503314 [Pleomassaria siparia CBS 279.74]|uniref:Uncharacterized protein n=1 Tax=Pleomassaria siparia CBS 279.74 TaxID=1314801 RepID=A0A6G1K5T1_9PLEO|nr:hypothetical protein K504DRAFT_503314 [Pleomassaria siparia CBS 279.74]